jgi:hypothetical protein
LDEYTLGQSRRTSSYTCNLCRRPDQTLFSLSRRIGAALLQAAL